MTKPNMTAQDKLQRYNDLVREVRLLEAELDELRPQVVSYLEKQGLDSLSTNYGTFTIATVAKYVFSDAVKQQEDELKRAKENEKEQGIAKREESSSLRFTPKA